MAEPPPVAALWIGGSLTWLERLCLASFVATGHPTVLYAYAPVAGVPEGVEIRDGRRVLEAETFLAHERSGSVALFSDLFRLHLLAKAPGVIWVDTDVYCWRPLAPGRAHVFGYEAARRLNGAVLALPPDSEALGLMLAQAADEYAIPEYLAPALRAECEARAAAGAPLHVSEMPWGVWGPHLVTWALKKTGEAKYAEAREAFYPVQFADRAKFFRRPVLGLRDITPETRTVHVWGRIKRIAAKRHGGLAPEKSFLKMLLDRHGIDQRDWPVTSHGKFCYFEGREVEP